MSDDMKNRKNVRMPPNQAVINAARANIIAHRNDTINRNGTTLNLDILKQQKSDPKNNMTINRDSKVPLTGLNLRNLRADLNKPKVTDITTIDDDTPLSMMKNKRKAAQQQREYLGARSVAAQHKPHMSRPSASTSSAAIMMESNQNNRKNNAFNNVQTSSDYEMNYPASNLQLYSQQAQSRAVAQAQAHALVQVQMQAMKAQARHEELLKLASTRTNKRVKLDSLTATNNEPSSNPPPDSYRFADPVEDVETTGVYDHTQKFKNASSVATTSTASSRMTNPPPMMNKANTAHITSILNQNAQINNAAAMAFKNIATPPGPNVTRTMPNHNPSIINLNNVENRDTGKGSINAIEVKDDDDDNGTNNGVSVTLPLVGPFVNGFLSGVKPIIEFFEGNPESIIHETTSKILFAISQHGGSIESQKDRVTFPLSETEAVASDFISEQHSKITDAIRLSFVETKNNHELIVKEAGIKMEKCLEQRLEKKDQVIAQMKENLNTLAQDHEDEMDKMKTKYEDQLKEIKALQRKELSMKDKQLEDERKNHRRGLAAYLHATQRTFQQMMDDESFDSN